MTAKTKPAINHTALTPHNTTQNESIRAVRVLTAGNLRCSLSGDPSVLLTYAVTAGEIIPIELSVFHTDSTCTLVGWS